MTTAFGDHYRPRWRCDVATDGATAQSELRSGALGAQLQSGNPTAQPRQPRDEWGCNLKGAEAPWD